MARGKITKQKTETEEVFMLADTSISSNSVIEHDEAIETQGTLHIEARRELLTGMLV